MSADQAADAGLESGRRQELQGGQHPPVDQAGPDAETPASVDRDVRALEDAVLALILAHQQDLPDRGVLRARTEERIDSGGAVHVRGLEQLPTVEDRLGI